jgi:hypothetical protein
VLPSVVAHRIEGLRKLLRGLMQGLGLLRHWMQLYSHGSIHRTNVADMSSFCKR